MEDLGRNSKLKEETGEHDKRRKFGTRYLTDPQNVFQHNAWDNVVWDAEQEEAARSITEKQILDCMNEDKKEEFEHDTDKFWNVFYDQHQNRFFKDRHWLFTEFPELYGQEHKATKVSTTDSTESAQNEVSDVCSVSEDAEKQIEFRMLEVGCGVGNTVFPVLKTNNSPGLMMYCCDFSSTAIQLVKDHPDYESKRCHAFVHDITNTDTDLPLEPSSLDLVIMIFILSAVSPDKMQAAVNHLVKYLKPGGALLFRDYGRYDMAQLRFKPGRCISDNFYARGDGTCVYFFTQDELHEMFEKAGMVKKENMIDRRLQVNRGRQLKMYRVWIQCKYVKS